MHDDLKAVVAELERLAKRAEPSLTNGRASVKVMAQTLRDGHAAQRPRFDGPITPDADAAYIIAACVAVPKLISALRQRDEALESVRAERDLYRLVAVNQGWNWRLCDAYGRDEYQKQREKHVDDCVAVAQSHAARAILTERETNAR